MHNDILTPKQTTLLPAVKKFSKSFYLVGGTALALQLGHRRSVDFDLFSDNEFKNQTIRASLRKHYPIEETFVNQEGEFTITVNTVRCTFFHFPYPVPHPVEFLPGLFMPEPLVIGAMKAFALGGCAKWKDYVDLYFIFQHHSLSELVDTAKSIFQGEFEEKLFREQLAYFQDINYSEEVDFMPGLEVPKEKILDTLLTISVS